MVRNLLCAMVLMLVSVGLVLADEFQASITKVDGGKITFQKMKKADKKLEKDGDPVTLPVADKVTVAKAKINKDTKKFEAGDPVEGGLKHEVFAKIGDGGMPARITTDDGNKKVTQILLFQSKKK